MMGASVGVAPQRLPWPFGDGCLLCWLVSKSISLTGLIGFGAFGDAGGCSCTPSYVTGNRNSSITVTTTLSLAGGAITSILDGDTSTNSYSNSTAFSSAAVSGKEIRFQFSASTKITEAKWYQSTSDSHGTWKWQGSNDGSNWTDIGNSFTVGGTTTQTQTELSSNILGYLYYRLLGVSGNTATPPWIYEIEFKQCAC